MIGFRERLGDGRARWLLEYRILPMFRLLRRGELAYLVGVLAERLFGRNLYVWYLDTRDIDPHVVRTINGRRMVLDLRDRGLCRHLFVDGTHERRSMAAFEAAMRSLSGPITILDVGANIGYYALVEATAAGRDGSVYAFEPNPTSRAILERNVALNDVADRVSIVPSAASDENGTREFCISHHSNWSRLTSDPDVDCDRVIETEVVRVDDFLEDRGIDPNSVRAVRMDVEGHEHAILSGMESVLSARTKLILFIEFHPKNLGEKYRELLGLLERDGFDILHVGHGWQVLDVDSYRALRSFNGSHVRVIFRR